MAHPFPITYQGGESPIFLQRLQALPNILQHCKDRLDQLGLTQSHNGLAEVKVFEAPVRGKAGYYYDKGDDSISIFPMLCGPRPDLTFYTAIGARTWARLLSDEDKHHWSSALVYPNAWVLGKLSSAIAEGGRTWEELVDLFQDPPDRLAAIEVVNALTSNHIIPPQAQNLDLLAYPPTAGILSGAEPFSALPILEAFRPGHGKSDSYSEAFSEFCGAGHFEGHDPSICRLYADLFRFVTPFEERGPDIL